MGEWARPAVGSSHLFGLPFSFTLAKLICRLPQASGNYQHAVAVTISNDEERAEAETLKAPCSVMSRAVLEISTCPSLSQPQIPTLPESALHL